MPADAILTASLNGEEESNLPGLPPPDFAGEVPSCWLMLLCCCSRKSLRRVTVTPPPIPTVGPPAGLGAIGIGRVGVPAPLPPDGRSLMGVVGILVPLREKS